MRYSAVIPAQAGIQQNKFSPHSGRDWGFVPLRGAHLINWIPACAGMTGG